MPTMSLDKPKFSMYDIESGRSSSSTARGIRRLFGRRIKLIALIFLAGCGFVFYSDISGSGLISLPGGPGHSQDFEGNLDGIWEVGREDGTAGQGGWGLPVIGGGDRQHHKVESDSTFQNTLYEINEHGDHFLKRWKQKIAPMHPDLSELPNPSELFPEIGVSTGNKKTSISSSYSNWFQPPQTEPFPSSRLSEIISDPNHGPKEDQEEEGLYKTHAKLSEDAWSLNWKGPEEWDLPHEKLNRIQWSGFAGGRDGWENEKERKVREERREAVRRGFAWGWQKYKDYAWGHDEVRPVTKTASDPFNQWGASIVDTLDTLLIMGFSDEYNLCRPHVNQLNFQWVSGKDWANNYLSPESIYKGDDENNEPEEAWGVLRDRTVSLPVFETGIRYLGGLLGGYDLSGDDLLLGRAVDLAHVMKRAFTTESGLPIGRMDPGYEAEFLYLGSISLAEVGSMTVELIRLSQITKDRQWFDLAQRVTDFIEENVIPRATTGNLIPMTFFPDGGPLHGPLTWGGMADSYYEYLIKTYKLLGGGEIAEQYKRIYEKSVDSARESLFVDITVVPDRDLMAIGKFEHGHLIPEIEHLTCFAGGMLGMGSRLLDRSQDMIDAERFTKSCYWLSAATPTGLQPEVVEFFSPVEGVRDMYENVTLTGLVYHPGVNHALYEHEFGHGGGLLDGDVSEDEEQVGQGRKPVEFVERLKGSPPGSRRITGRGLNRPETIESIFYMYRLTGDRKWQEKGWKMFVSWSQAAKVDGGFSSIYDVSQKEYYHSDNMESFMFAETLKYHFLLQSEPDVISLDDYVLNTEAHTLIANPSISPGSQRFWTPPPKGSKLENLGERAQGTDVQKWQRLQYLQLAKQPFMRNSNSGLSGVAGGGAGRGMGGGGGDPNHRPQPPPEFFQREDIKGGR